MIIKDPIQEQAQASLFSLHYSLLFDDFTLINRFSNLKGH